MYMYVVYDVSYRTKLLTIPYNTTKSVILICVLLCCWSQRFGISLRAKHNYCNPNTCRKLFLWHACQLLSTSTTFPVQDVLLDQTSSSCWCLTNKANAGFFPRIHSAKRKVVPHGLLVATHVPTARVEDAVVFGLLCCISKCLGNVHINGVDKHVFL